MSEHNNIRHAADTLAAYAMTCRMRNTLQWMDGFAELISQYMESVQDPLRVVIAGDSMTQVSPEEYQHHRKSLENER